MGNKTLAFAVIISSVLCANAWAAGDRITGYYYDPNYGVVIPQYDNATPDPLDTSEYISENPVTTPPETTPDNSAAIAQAKAKVDQAQATVTATQSAMNIAKAAMELAQEDVAKKQTALADAKEKLQDTWDDITNFKNLGQFISAWINLPKARQNVNTAQAQLQTAEEELASAQADFADKENQAAIAQNVLTQAQAELNSFG